MKKNYPLPARIHTYTHTNKQKIYRFFNSAITLGTHIQLNIISRINSNRCGNIIFDQRPRCQNNEIQKSFLSNFLSLTYELTRNRRLKIGLLTQVYQIAITKKEEHY